MGNSASSGRGHHEDTVDYGYLTPQGVYTGPRDWNQTIVTQLICERKLAPFYRPLDDYEDNWEDEQILAARKEPPDSEASSQGDSSVGRADSIASTGSRTHHKRPSNVKEVQRPIPEAAIYRGAIECPICFLYYPPNINHSRCCDQAICTECFVQIKRAEPNPTHLVSEPACCPYCVQENFGVVYTPPPWRAGIGSEGATPPSWPDSPKGSTANSVASSNAAMKRRRKSFGHDSPDVVTIDQIRPDWEAKLAAVRAAVQRRANRRIIMRQVGDRLIPVGVTSGRVHALPTEDGGEADGNGERGSRRSRRRNQNPDLNQLLGTMGLGGQDLEELMVMEAMRLSLLEHEEQQRKQKEEEEKKKREEGDAEGVNQTENAGPSTTPSIETPSSAVSSSTSTRTDNASTNTLISPSASTSHASSMSGGRDVSPPIESATPPARSTHGSSLSVSSLSPDQRSIRSQKRRSASPFIGAALQSATSTASAVVSPSPGEPSGSTPEEDTPVLPHPTMPISRSPSRASTHSSPTPTSPESTVTPEESGPDAEPITPPSDPIPVPVDSDASPPLTHHSASFASSIEGDINAAYDVLPSSPASSGSSLSRKPLLDAQSEVNDMRTVTSSSEAH